MTLGDNGTDGQTDGQTDRQTDRRTDRQSATQYAEEGRIIIYASEINLRKMQVSNRVKADITIAYLTQLCPLVFLLLYVTVKPKTARVGL